MVSQSHIVSLSVSFPNTSFLGSQKGSYLPFVVNDLELAQKRNSLYGKNHIDVHYCCEIREVSCLLTCACQVLDSRQLTSVYLPFTQTLPPLLRLRRANIVNWLKKSASMKLLEHSQKKTIGFLHKVRFKRALQLTTFSDFKLL